MSSTSTVAPRSFRHLFDEASPATRSELVDFLAVTGSRPELIAPSEDVDLLLHALLDDPLLDAVESTIGARLAHYPGLDGEGLQAAHQRFLAGRAQFASPEASRPPAMCGVEAKPAMCGLTSIGSQKRMAPGALRAALGALLGQR